MKNKLMLLFVAVSLTLTSCDIGDSDIESVQLEIAAITEVDMPATFQFGTTTEIPVRFQNPSSCHFFVGFDIRSDLNEREVRVVLEERDNGDCDNLPVPQEETLTFVAASNGNYVFKFFSGLDSNGDARYLEYRVEVVD